MLLADVCENAGFILRILVKVIKYAHIFVPILLIVLITYDLVKAFVGQLDDKAKKEASNKAVRRLIYAIIVFFVPTIINFTFKTIDNLVGKNNTTDATSTTSTSWMKCWVAEYNK